MTIFIYTPKGYINLSRVDSVRHKSNNNYGIVVNDDEVDNNNAGLGLATVAIVPVQGEWDCLAYDKEADALLIDPVVAWGQTFTGVLKPITATEMEGVDGDYALRRRGEDRVYANGVLGGYVNAQAWIKSIPR